MEQGKIQTVKDSNAETPNTYSGNQMTPSTESNIALMIDIETLSLNPAPYITQIGYCVADLDTRTYWVKPRNIWTTNDQLGEIDFDTVSWWMKQDPKVSASVFNAAAVRRDADSVFNELASVVRQHNATVWGSPAMFDLPALTFYFGARKPWKYNAERDMMTLYKLLDPTGDQAPPKNEMAHNAAADAEWQMEYLFVLWARLKALGAVQ